MKKTFLALICLGMAGVANADAGLDQLRASFADVIKNSTKEFDRAAEMKLIDVKRGRKLELDECGILSQRAQLNYVINPFEMSFEQGVTYNYMCGGKFATQPNFVTTGAGKTNFGLPYMIVVQLEAREPNRNQVTNYFFDSQFRIVETQVVNSRPGTTEALEYVISSVDANGNVYIKSFAKNFSLTNTDIEGTETMERFITTDGAIPFPFVRHTVRHPTDSTKDYQLLRFERADKQDWDNYDLVITHAWDGGYYNYSGKYLKQPNNASSITVKSRGGKEYCAIGSVNESGKWVSYPADQKEYYKCINN